jgi:hypothetical protein
MQERMYGFEYDQYLVHDLQALLLEDPDTLYIQNLIHLISKGATDDVNQIF